MPEYLTPGVYIEEINTGPRPIEGAGTACAGFVIVDGATRRPTESLPASAFLAGRFPERGDFFFVAIFLSVS